MSTNTYVIGAGTRATFGIADIARQAVDPAALRLLVKPPGGAAATHEYGVSPLIVRDGIGAFHADVPLTVAGTWSFRLETESPSGVAETQITVTKSLLT